ncbi:MAG: monovalent cation/H(+) antiporter subunit G [Oscillospiraceae bacterium]|nr:monovalent cation/H(+) antiporter subunit G [Oscillospiraceae bacterium]
MIRTILAVALMCFGMFSVCVSALGLFRFQCVLNRIHAAAVTDTLGVLGLMLGLVLLCGWTVMTVKICIIIVFMWLAGPVVTHLVAKMELLTERNIDAEAPHEEGELLL